MLAGAAIPEFYVSGPNGANIPLRLVGWERINDKAAGEERKVTVAIDPRLLAQFDEADPALAHRTRRLRVDGGI